MLYFLIQHVLKYPCYPWMNVSPQYYRVILLEIPMLSLNERFTPILSRDTSSHTLRPHEGSMAQYFDLKKKTYKYLFSSSSSSSFIMLFFSYSILAPFCRSYYRCTQDNCRVKKRVERLAEDPRMVITTYEGRHAHSPSHDEDDSQAPNSHLDNFFF